MTRNLSPQRMYEEWGIAHQPTNAFSGENADDFSRWKSETLTRVLATAGEFPLRVEPNAELLAEWTHDGLRKQRWMIDVGEHISATFLINFPSDMKDGEKRPAILCWHGHGAFGKEPVMGNNASAELREAIENHNYNYGHEMAKAGFITFAIDWLAGGERGDGQLHNGSRSSLNRDWCNILYLHATMLGMTSISINVQHGRAATDFACSFAEVDANRLGVMGLSGGGTMALWSSLFDERIRATEIICYSGLWRGFGLRDTNYCGMQVAPGLFKLVDLPDLQGLIAPRPLLVDIGAYDSCFRVGESMECFHQVEKIYRAADAEIELDLHPGEHGWGGNKSVEFFGKHLK